MAEAVHLVDPETCEGDGICVEVCPENVLEIVDDTARTVEAREGRCIRLLLPAILVVATPLVLLWPGKKQTDGSRAPRQVGQRYLKILRFWKSFAEYLH